MSLLFGTTSGNKFICGLINKVGRSSVKITPGNKRLCLSFVLKEGALKRQVWYTLSSSVNIWLHRINPILKVYHWIKVFNEFFFFKKSMYFINSVKETPNSNNCRAEPEQRGSPLCPVSTKPERPSDYSAGIPFCWAHAPSLTESAEHKGLCSTWAQAAH